MDCLKPIGMPLREKSISSQNINDETESIYSTDKKTGRWTKNEDDMLREVKYILYKFLNSFDNQNQNFFLCQKIN